MADPLCPCDRPCMSLCILCRQVSNPMRTEKFPCQKWHCNPITVDAIPEIRRSFPYHEQIRNGGLHKSCRGREWGSGRTYKFWRSQTQPFIFEDSNLAVVQTSTLLGVVSPRICFGQAIVAIKVEIPSASYRYRPRKAHFPVIELLQRSPTVWHPVHRCNPSNFHIITLTINLLSSSVAYHHVQKSSSPFPRRPSQGGTSHAPRRCPVPKPSLHPRSSQFHHNPYERRSLWVSYHSS